MARYNTKGLTLDPKTFQHPLDRQATEAIQASEVFQKILQWISKNSVEREMRMLYRSSMAQVTASVSPKLTAMVDEGCRMFGAEKKPEVFMERTYDLTMHLQGVDQPMLVISTGLFPNVTEQGLWGLIAGQMSAIRSGYCQIRFVQMLCAIKGLLPDSLAAPMVALFITWQKYAQLSLDRAALLATGDLNETARAILAGRAPLAVLEKMDLADPSCGYMTQAREFLRRPGAIAGTMKSAKAVIDDELYLAGRYVELFDFYQTAYQDILDDQED